jgi:hypothetical protein
MDLARFNADDIHELRTQMFERWRNMPSDEAEREYQQKAENTRRAIEEIRAAKNAKAE